MRLPREKRIRLERVTLVTFEGPGTEWICVIRGTRQGSERKPKGTRPGPRLKRREGSA
jgi:hypothetical protein